MRGLTIGFLALAAVATLWPVPVGPEASGDHGAHEHVRADPWNLTLSIVALGLVAFLLFLLLGKRGEGS
jgi:hypothetical protein